MSQQLINRSADLRRLREEGYTIGVQAGHLVLEVPYVTANREIKQGFLVTDLTLAGNVTAAPGTHVVHFIGEHPCHKDGSPIKQIQHQEGDKELTGRLRVNRSFSNRLTMGYSDYYEKMATYANIISGPAEAIDSERTARSYRTLPSDDDDSVFHYLDTASTRAGISSVSDKLRGQRVGIIGLGGTGSYVLDLVAKCPVAQIKLFDGDHFLQHNAFRSPGAATKEVLEASPKKAAHFASLYSAMHRHITAYPSYLGEENVHALQDLDFVFLCIDNGEAKRVIVQYLETRNVSFVDVGMGIQLSDDSQLRGIVRITTSTPTRRGLIPLHVSFSDGAENDYTQNIQIAELNALNASLAVVKWKKLLGFYADVEQEHHSTYTIDGNMLLSEGTR